MQGKWREFDEQPETEEALFLRPLDLLESASQSLPLVLSSPHSGRCYPTEFQAQSRLSALDLRRSEDCYVDLLLADAAAAGIPLLAARFPRAYLDVNREPLELDPRLFKERLPAQANTRSVRVANGLGIIPRIVSEGRDIYANGLSLADGLRRIDQLHRPYHTTLRHLINRTHQHFGAALLLDVHSMPSSSVAHTSGGPMVDVVLGDRYGCSAAPDVVDAAVRAFRSFGLNAVVNRPYAGGYITEHYGEPNRQRHVLQIEINRALYLNETTLEPLPEFDVLRRGLGNVILDIAQNCRLIERYSEAAE